VAVIIQFDLGSDEDMATIRRFLAETASTTPVAIPAPPLVTAPPPPPPPPMAVAPPPMAVAPPPVVEDEADVDVTGLVDSDGLPWDVRIHSSSKQTVADGTWRKRRNTSKELVAEVEAELRGANVPVPPAVDVPVPPAVDVPVPPAAVAFANPAPVADNQLDLFIRAVTAKMIDRSLEASDLHRVLSQYNVEHGLLGLKDHLRLIPILCAQFGVAL
jgi:hypothetical protein